MFGIGLTATIVYGALIAFILFIVSMPVGSKAGRSAGVRMLVGTLVAFVLVVGVSVATALGNGEWDAFRREFGTDAPLQIGVFVVMVLFTTYFFASRYLDDIDR